MYVDITKKPIVTAVEWFHGYGGNALGLKRAIPGLCSIAVCERDAFVVANMVSKMEKGLLDAVPIWTDVTDFPTRAFGCGQLDLFVASYPCQGFSHAGKRLGADDHRHLWPYCRKFIGAVRPKWVWLENVEGHVSLGLSTVLADLAEDGYEAAWGIFSASEIGAPHQRKRVFILAYDKSMQCYGSNNNIGVMSQQQEIPELGNGSGENELAIRNGIGLSHGESQKQPAEAGIDALGNSAASGREDVAHGDLWESQRANAGGSEEERARGPLGLSDRDSRIYGNGGAVWPSRPGQAQYGWEPPRVVGFTENVRMEGREHDNTESNRPGGSASQPGRASGKYSELRETQSSLGRNPDGTPHRLDFPRLSGLSDSELEEIYEWMVKGTNRTDELRMCGNGVVPQTAEKAFRVLYEELRNM